VRRSFAPKWIAGLKLRKQPTRKRTNGVVTRTQIGRAQSGGASSGLGSGSGFPCPERFVSKDAERVAGCEMKGRVGAERSIRMTLLLAFLKRDFLVELRGFEPMSIADAVRSTPIPIFPVFRLSRAAGRVPAPISDSDACLAWRVAGRWPSAFRCRACGRRKDSPHGKVVHLRMRRLRRADG
jgi:hypothetical protein